MLVTVVQRALNQNLDLDAALARVRQARAAASGAGAELLPTADLGASATLSTRAFAASSVPSLQAPRASNVTGTQMWSGRRAGKSISPAGYAEARRRLEMTHRRLKPIRRGLGRHGVAKAPVADQRLQCETSHKPPLLNAVHLDRAAPNNLYSPPDEWLKRGTKSGSRRQS